MARLVIGAALAMAAGVLAGCGPGKDLPDAVPQTPDPADTPAAVPAASDPASKAYVEKVVKAYTGGKPELVARGKASRLVLTGARIHPVDNERVPVTTTRTIAAVWPDRFRGSDELELRGNRTTYGAWLIRSKLVMTAGGVEAPFPAGAEHNLAGDETAQHWMALMLPLTDPKAILFDLRKETYQQKPAQSLKLSLGTYPVYQLVFDADTNALLRVDYTMKEEGARRRKQWSMAEHKPGPEGLLLPTRFECRHDNVVVEEWSTAKWEFPAAIDDAEFSPPKK